MKEIQSIPLFDDSFKQNPNSIYRRLLERSPIHYVLFPSGVRGWLVTGYDAAIQTLTHPDIGKNHALGNSRWRALASIMPEPQHSQLQAHLLHQDPPKHTVMRSLITPTFAASRIEGFRHRITGHVNQLLDTICEKGHADLIKEFAAKLSWLVLSEVVGLSDSLRDQFKSKWCRAVLPAAPNDPDRHAYIGTLVELQTYIENVIALSRGGDGASLVVQLISAHDAGKLSYNELTSMLFQLLVAGQEPVTNQIGSAVLELLRHPDQMQRLIKAQKIDANALNELLRFNSAFELSTWRFFPKTTNLFGVSIPAGDSVIVSINAANRDPKRFQCPHKLDLGRPNNAPLTFGHDHHYCPAASLVRLELEVSLQQILKRLPNLRLSCPPQELKWTNAVQARGLCKLPVTFTTKSQV
jgi:hypothetical protein